MALKLALHPKQFDVERSGNFSRSFEARVALSRAGYQKLARLIRPTGAPEKRTDLYFEAWDGKRFLFDGERTPWKLRLKRSKEDGESSYELSVSTAGRMRGGLVTVRPDRSATIPLKRKQGKMLMRYGEALLARLRSGDDVPNRDVRRLDKVLRHVLDDASFDREVLGQLDGNFRLVPSDLNTKVRVRGSIDGGPGVGDIQLALGKTMDRDPVTGADRTRYELEAEPERTTRLDQARLRRVLSQQLRLDELRPADRVGQLPEAKRRTLRQWNLDDAAQQLVG